MPTTANRVVIIGCGRVAGGFNEHDAKRVLTHVVAYRTLGASIVGCCDLDGGKAERFADRWSVPHHSTSLDAVLESTQPEVVSICTPTAGRVPVVECVLATSSVRAVLLEKPIAACREETQAISQLAARSARPVLVNYCRAFDPFYRQVRYDCEDGRFGSLRQVVGRYYGTARNNASHLIERVIHIVGKPSHAQRLAGSADAPVFEVSFAASRVTAMFLPTPGCEYAPLELDLLFEHGRIRVIDSERRAERFMSRPDENFDGFFNLAPIDHDAAAAPCHDSILYAVEAVLRVAAGQPLVDDVFGRGIMVDAVLDQIGAQ